MIGKLLIPEKYQNTTAAEIAVFLANALTERGLDDTAHLRRFGAEMDVLVDKDLTDFARVLWYVKDVLLAHKQISLLRGSGGASLIGFLFGLTPIDPVEYEIGLDEFIKDTRPDYDIELCDNRVVRQLFPEAIPASQLTGNALVEHQTGVYFQDIPVEPETGLAVYPYDAAEKLGYDKFDFITNWTLQEIGTPERLIELWNREIDWDWFADSDFVSELPHCGWGQRSRWSSFPQTPTLFANYSPRSLLDIAHLTSLIRPGKRHLLSEPYEVQRAEMWKPLRLEDEGGKPIEAESKKVSQQNRYYLKKAHALAVAVTIVLAAQLQKDSFDGLASRKRA
jgi:hypothetical protein